MVTVSSRRIAAAVAVAAAAAAAVFVPPVLVALADQVAAAAGHMHIDKAGRLQQWAASRPLNNGACVVETAANACEDVVVHAASSTVFAACGDPRGRAHWYPPAGQRDARGRLAVGSSFRETLFKHDLQSGVTTELRIEGVEGDFVTHGVDIWSSPDDPSTIHIFAVRHTRTGDSVSIFSHKLGTDTVVLVRDVRHPNIKTANGVAAVGLFEFYVTNDHYFFSDPWRTLEEHFGPWTWATNVQYCDAASEASLDCDTVVGPFPAANGIAVWEDRLFVGDSQNGTLRVFQQRADHDVEYLSQVELGAAADNIKIDPSTGDLIVAVFPTVENLPAYLANVDKLGKELRVPAATLRLPKASDYAPELLYFDDGGVLSDMTAMALDPVNNVLVGAAVLQYGGFAVCKMGHSK
ncbi:hypothetical protein HMPREF1624_06626 [Sporothrix schenckii ATCC 58251]|uniref:SMP-30/Gluconolactonase/LRE-like region domain-containing protein n=1 Tax=Sporothrix schenckii (strain ATCC 58251 / de Perez 2211183) TaxID=1391915 RepID=U7PRB9_SPOS1|nr:hypothetical protein HMPREF1624_06626 [Sporothrix schenckii ATCC 58251]